MPPRVERCVQSLMDDPNFKPKKPNQSKEDAAWALCTYLDQEGYLRDSIWGMKMAEKNITEAILTGPFKIVLPITGVRTNIIKKADGEEKELWLHVEASGPERDADGDRMEKSALESMVRTANGLLFCDGHYRDLLASILGTIHGAHLTEENHFAFDVLLKQSNPFAMELFQDILRGKKHGASIAGVVHDADVEEYGDGEIGRVFKDIELVEVSRTSWPSWRPSFVTLLADKVGKMPEDELAAVIKRRQELIELGEKDMDMLVKLDNGSEEIWTEDEQGVVVQKLKSPHGWDKKFKVSKVPWTSVTNRSKPCQFAIIKMKEDGTFSRSKSGYPHHMPDCATINRGGVIGAAVRLIQAMKSSMPELEVPPVESMAAENIGAEELEAYEKQVSRFTRDELKFAARHILKHYRRDLDMEPPENLVAVAKSYENETEEVLELVKGLVNIIELKFEHEDTSEVNDMDNEKETVEEVVENPETAEETAAEESTPEQEEETAAETEDAEAETPVEETEEAEAEKSEAAGETLEKANDSLASVVDSRLLARRFSEATYAMQDMVTGAVRDKDLGKAVQTIDEFGVIAKNTVTRLIQSGVGVSLSFLEAFEERIELKGGQLTKSRVERIDEAIENITGEFVSLRKLFSDSPVVDDMEVAVKAAQIAREEESELSKRVEAEMEAKTERLEADVKEVAELLAEDVPAEPKSQRTQGDETPVVELTEEQKRQGVNERFLKSLG